MTVRALPALLRRHAVLAVLLGLGLALRVIVMIAYRPAIFYIDSFASYLQKLPTLDPAGQDPIGYDALLLKPVLAIGTPTTVVALQHLLGLAMAVTGYAVLVRHGAWRALAALAMAPILLDAYQVQIEQNIMSDTLFEALIVAVLAVLAVPRRVRWPAALAAGLLLGLSITVRQVGLPLIVLAVAYLLVVGGTWRRRLALSGVLVVSFAVPVAVYAADFHHVTGQWGLSKVGGNALYGRVATFADCTGVDLPPELRQLCPTMPRADRPGPDYWAHDPRSPVFHATVPPGRTIDDLLRAFDQRMIMHQPFDFARSVAADGIRVFGWGRTSTEDDVAVERWQFQTEFPTFPDLVTIDSITQMTQRYGGGPPTVVVPLARGLRWYQLHLGFTPGPVLLLCLLAGLAGAVAGRRRRPGHADAGRTGAGGPTGVGDRPAAPGRPVLGVDGLPLRAVALLYLAFGLALLLFADVFLFSWRYQLPGYVILPTAGALGVTALARRWRPAVAAGPTAGGDAPALGGPPALGAAGDTPARGTAAEGFPEPADKRALEEFTRRYGHPVFPDVVVVIAAYNEAGGLGQVLEKLPTECLDLPVTSLVVVDGATDGTAALARGYPGYVCDVPVNRGQGAALRLGYHLARAYGARFIVTTDADGQYDLTELPVLLAPLLAGEADFVTGSRRLGANESTDPVRRLGTRVFAWLVSSLTGTPVTDTSFGFRAMRAELTAQVRLTQPQYQSSELLIGLLCRGARVVERPMTMRRRGQGRSKKGGNLVYGLRYARVVLGTWWRERNTSRSSTTNLTRNIAA